MDFASAAPDRAIEVGATPAQRQWPAAGGVDGDPPEARGPTHRR
ncbi:hypothetical protein [Devosia sp.]